MRPSSKCHPDRLHVAHGLCAKCYRTRWHKENYVPSTDPMPWKASIQKANKGRWKNHKLQTREEFLAKRRIYVAKWLAKNRERLSEERRHRWRTDAHYRQEHKRKGKARRLMRQYGLTLEQFRALESQQEGKCGICKQKDKRMVIDHDHVTKEVRGLLCDRCNRLLGVARDESSRLWQAAQYLEAKAWQRKNN